MTALFVAREIRWGGLPAQIAINALIVHVKPTQHVVWIPVCNVRHKITSFQVSCSPVSGCKVLVVGIRSPTQL
jgi:hypothetical protein